METIQVIKFYNGDEIVCFCEKTENRYLIKEPFQFFLRVDKNGEQSISMDHWLPNPVIKTNFTFVNEEKIIAVMEPSDDFKEYYINCIEAIKTREKESKEKEKYIEQKAEELMRGILESLQVPESKFLH